MDRPRPLTVLDQQSFEPEVPNIARIYDALLGGKDNFEADRKAVAEVARLRPQVFASVRANRAFLGRVVRYLAADCGVRQFIDVGAGLPCADNTHEMAQRVDPACRVVYVDCDPMVLVHARALLTCTAPGSCDYVDADVRDTSAILAGAARSLDLAQPVAVLLLAVLHFCAGCR